MRLERKHAAGPLQTSSIPLCAFRIILPLTNRNALYPVCGQFVNALRTASSRQATSHIDICTQVI